MEAKPKQGESKKGFHKISKLPYKVQVHPLSGLRIFSPTQSSPPGLTAAWFHLAARTPGSELRARTPTFPKQNSAKVFKGCSQRFRKNRHDGGSGAEAAAELPQAPLPRVGLHPRSCKPLTSVWGAVAQPRPAEEAALAALRLRLRAGEARPTEGRGGEDAPAGPDHPARDGGIYNGKTFSQVEIKLEMMGHYHGDSCITYNWSVKLGWPALGPSAPPASCPSSSQ